MQRAQRVYQRAEDATAQVTALRAALEYWVAVVDSARDPAGYSTVTVHQQEDLMVQSRAALSAATAPAAPGTSDAS